MFVTLTVHHEKKHLILTPETAGEKHAIEMLGSFTVTAAHAEVVPDGNGVVRQVILALADK
jgi:hypothetical protein